MPADWLIIWGATQLLARPVLEDLAQDFAKDLAKDYVKGCFGNVFKSLSKEGAQKALGRAIKELLQLMEDELLDNGQTEEQVKAWSGDFKEFTRTRTVQETIRRAFTEAAPILDAGLLARAWKEMAGPHPIPGSFNWERVATRFARAVRKIREEEKELRDALTAQTAAETLTAARQSAGIPPQFNLDAYRDALRRRYGNLRLESLDATGVYYRNAVGLRSIFIPQTVREVRGLAPQQIDLPKEYLRRLREADAGREELSEEILAEARRTYLDQSPRAVLEAVAESRIERIVIMGDPGSGKSSLLRYLALQWAEIAEATERLAAPLPILIELREYEHWGCEDDNKSFLRYLNDSRTWHRLNQFNLHERLSGTGNAILMLDGLDEIFDPVRRELAINDIQRFADEYRNVRIILTSRIYGYEKSQERMTDLGFTHMMLQELEEEQIEDFLDRWHRLTFDDPADREAKQARLRRAVAESRAIRELAGNPLLLTMMAILNRHQDLPRDRAQLYGQSSRLLLYDWKTDLLNEKFPQLKEHGIGYQEKTEMLRAVAEFMQSAADEKRGNIISREDLVRILREYLTTQLSLPNGNGLAQALVDQLRGQNFILSDLGNDHYAFVHRTFLEFFTASALARRSVREENSLDFLKKKVFEPHWRDETWHEVLRLIVGMEDLVPIDRAAALIELLLAQEDHDFTFHHIFLAANCSLELRNPRLLGSVRDRIEEKLLDLAAFDYPYFYEFYEAEAQQIGEIRARAVRLIAAAQLLSNTRRWLEDRAANDDNWAVRQAAVQELARGWKLDPDTLPWLKDRAANDSSPTATETDSFMLRHFSVRSVALDALYENYMTDPTTLPFLQSRAQNDPHPVIREIASEIAKKIEKRRRE